MWTSDELTPRSRTFIPDRGARTFNLARLSHMKRTTDTRCGSRPLTQVYTLTLSHTLSQTHYRAHTTLCHTHLISLSLSYTLSCPIQLSLSFIYSHNNTTRDFEIVHSNLLLTHSLNDASHSDTHRMQMRGEVISVAVLHIPLYLHQLSLSLSYTQTPIRHLLSISLSLRVAHTRNLFWVHIVKLFCYLTFCLFIPLSSIPHFSFFFFLPSSVLSLLSFLFTWNEANEHHLPRYEKIYWVSWFNIR